MLLAIDCGNTNIVFAVYNGDTCLNTWRCQTQATRTADEYASWLIPLFSDCNIDFKDITSALISSVVPNVNTNLRRLCEKYCDVQAKFIKDSDVKIELEIDLPNPETLGADRIVNAVAAKVKYQMPFIIIDFGTATTFDIVNDKGAYIGGAIAPGVNLSAEALHNAAAALPKITVQATRSVIANTTITAMQSGLYWGYVSMIEGMVQRMADEMGQKPIIIATGGLARIIAEGTKIIDHVEDGLTLEGLKIIHDLNLAQDTLLSVA
jgi:type III pantothenate kinase